MLSKILSATTVGLDGVLIKVEVDVADRGFPTFTIVGLPSKAIEESKERVRTAIRNSGFEMPESKIVVNLAPADIPKEGSHFDLPIAVGILASAGMIERSFIKNSLFVGELSLDGAIRPVLGMLPIAILTRDKKIAHLFVPKANVKEAALIKPTEVYSVKTLIELILHLNGQQAISPTKHVSLSEIIRSAEYDFDFADIRGQESAKRALMIAAAGFHNVHLKGPPGAGKTLLSRSFPSILPSMDEDEIIEASKIYSVSGEGNGSSFMVTRPFRSPHHTISRVGLVGGGNKLTPGEISFAHRGVLFLDEFPEFPRSVLEALRQPMEDGIVTIARAKGSVTFPARFLLLCASNPCPCGYLGHPKKSCKCSLSQIANYKKRISGPMLDRIDLHVDVPPVEEAKLVGSHKAESSDTIRKRVEQARARQQKRFADTRIKSNGEMTPQQIKKSCILSKEAIELLKQAVSRLSLSARSYFKIIKIAQTIADLSGENTIKSAYIAEAMQYRVKEE